MAFRITTFAGVTLPAYNWTMDFSTPATVNPVVNTLNGVLDFYGVRRRITHQQEFELDAEPDPTSVQTTVRTLKKLVGKTGYLVRVHTDGTNVLRRYCRLLWVGFQPKATQRGIINKLTMRFYTLEPFWRSPTTTTHGPTAISSGSSINLTIAGEEDVLDAVLTVVASSNISSITVSHFKTEDGETIRSLFAKSSTLAILDSWIVDCGEYTAKVGSSGDLANFSLNVLHTEVYWLRLPAGSNTLVITLGSGSGTYRLDYNAVYQ